MITLKDKLSHLNYTQACKLLGPEGKKLIMAGGKYDIDIFAQTTLKKNLFRLDLGDAVVSIGLDDSRNQKLNIECSACPSVQCEHKGAALSLVLEEKMSLGLSAPPPEKVPVESLSEEDLVIQAIEDRAERAQKEKMRIKSMNSKEMLKRNAKAGRKIKYGDRIKLEVISDTKHYKKGQIINPHVVMGEQLIKDKIAKEVK